MEIEKIFVVKVKNYWDFKEKETNYNFPRVDERRLDRDCSVRKFKVYFCVNQNWMLIILILLFKFSNILRVDHSWYLITVILFVLSFAFLRYFYDFFTWRTRCDKKTRLYNYVCFLLINFNNIFLGFTFYFRKTCTPVI